MTKEQKSLLSIPKEQRIMYFHGSKYYMDWNKSTESVELFNWDTDKIFNSLETPPKCPQCKKSFKKDTDPNNNYWLDPCLGKIPGVKAACCGHGIEDGYIWFENDRLIRFPKNVEIYESKNFINKNGLLDIKEKKLNKNTIK